jgi:hypothetical protein
MQPAPRDGHRRVFEGRHGHAPFSHQPASFSTVRTWCALGNHMKGGVRNRRAIIILAGKEGTVIQTRMSLRIPHVRNSKAPLPVWAGWMERGHPL